MNRSERVQTPARRSDEIPGRLAYSVPEVAVLLGGVTERYVWKLIDGGTGPLRSFLLGKRRVVYYEDLDTFVRELREDEQRARSAAADAA
ncbi:DNA-binding protein [Micromonospora humidisoli]|uniref:DNA-binding protein n=1 Tax=Micromonospora humidisoli TaxID=2807622 RepID=A0ABS2JAQ1_9ACTN|nr:DNA-binding protein [Micromonospora humidisoli]MBM7083632.1 DNA-binding protein [Micromonospora humidisoli]